MINFKLLYLFLLFFLLSLQGCLSSKYREATKDVDKGMIVSIACNPLMLPLVVCAAPFVIEAPFVAAEALSKLQGRLKEKEKEKICMYAYNNITEKWTEYSPYQSYVKEAKRLGLDCEIKEKKPHGIKENDKVICYKATDGLKGYWSAKLSNHKYVKQAKRLELDCGITEEK